MCQPSASRAIDLNDTPATIATTIIVAVIAITMRVRRSAAGEARPACLPHRNDRLLVHRLPVHRLLAVVHRNVCLLAPMQR